MLCRKRAAKTSYYPLCCRLAFARQHYLDTTTPERTRLLRLFAIPRRWTDRFLAAPSVLGVVDSYGIELLHPLREGRSVQQIGRKGKS
jgi:hypothetical protein